MKKRMLSSSILKKIKKEKIEQHSKLYFFTKFALFFVSGIMFFIIGIIATAIIWNFFHDMELLEIFSLEKILFFKALLLGFPILWFTISVLLGIFVSYFARNTKKGYRFSYKYLISVIIILQIACGLAIEKSPLGKHLEHRIIRQIHVLKYREKNFQELWQNPEKGLLIGEIITIDNDNGELLLLALNKEEWIVEFKEKNIRNKGPLSPSGKIRIIGKKINENEFEAKKIMGLRFDYSSPEPPRNLEERRKFLENLSPEQSQKLRKNNIKKRFNLKKEPLPEFRQGKLDEFRPMKPQKEENIDNKIELLQDVRKFHKDQLGF